MLLVYRLLTYILLPIAALFGIMAVIMLFSALGNVAALVPAFLTGATALYVFFSFRFLHRGILPARVVNASLRDWIRVNGLVALFYSSLLLVNGILFRNNKNLIKQMEAQVLEMQEKIPQFAAQTVDVPQIMNTSFFIMATIGSLFTVHILFTLYIMRKYRHLFGGSPATPIEGGTDQL